MDSWVDPSDIKFKPIGFWYRLRIRLFWHREQLEAGNWMYKSRDGKRIYISLPGHWP